MGLFHSLHPWGSKLKVFISIIHWQFGILEQKINFHYLVCLKDERSMSYDDKKIHTIRQIPTTGHKKCEICLDLNVSCSSLWISFPHATCLGGQCADLKGPKNYSWRQHLGAMKTPIQFTDFSEKLFYLFQMITEYSKNSSFFFFGGGGLTLTIYDYDLCGKNWVVELSTSKNGMLRLRGRLCR